MLKLVNTVQVNCDDDNIEDQGYCWGELILSLEPGETKKDAIEFLKKMGWDIVPETKIIDNAITVYDYKCYCPWCNKALSKEDYENSLEQNKY